MKAVVVEDANKLSIREVPEPGPPGPYRALTKVVCGSLCNSTDLEIFHRQLHFVTDYPTILGHEVVGRVIAVGEKVRNFRIGDLVSRPRACVPPELLLYESWGGFAEYGLVTDVRAIVKDGLTPVKLGRVPDQIAAPPDADPVALTQMVTLRETLSVLRNLGVKAGDSVVIFGPGPVGVSFSMLARQIGLDPVIVVGRREEPLERARTFGRATHVINNTTDNVPEIVRELTGGRGADWAIEAIGTDAVMPDALAAINPQGKVALYGVPDASEVGSALRRGPQISPRRADEGAAAEEIFDLVGKGLIPAREFVTHELPMVEAAEGLRLLEAKQAFKVLLWVEPPA